MYYYLDEKPWVERITATESQHPWRMEEILAIQRQLTTLEDLLLNYLSQCATPDPIEQLRQHLAKMLSTET